MDRNYIKEIQITNFKILKNKTFTLSPKLNVIIGANGTGKTTLLESIVYTIKRNVVCNFDVRPFDKDTIQTKLVLNDDTSIETRTDETIDDLIIFVLDNCGSDLPQDKIEQYAKRLKKESKYNQIVLVTYHQDIIDVADNVINLDK